MLRATLCLCVIALTAGTSLSQDVPKEINAFRFELDETIRAVKKGFSAAANRNDFNAAFKILWQGIEFEIERFMTMAQTEAFAEYRTSLLPKPKADTQPPTPAESTRSQKETVTKTDPSDKKGIFAILGGSIALVALVAFVGLLFNLTPFFIALYRGHESKWAILAVVLLFGWCIFGWIWALIWSLSNPGRVTVVNR
jgi:hypothetical protein